MTTRRPLRIQTINTIAFAVGLILSMLAIMIAIRISNENKLTNATHRDYEECVDAADTFMDTSDYLTTAARMYVATGSRTYADDYLHEILSEKRRDSAVQTLSDHVVGEHAQQDLADALTESNNLAERELYAMRLVADATNLGHTPKTLNDVQLNQEDAKLSSSEKWDLANEMVFGDEYQDNKERIIAKVDECSNKLIESLQDDERISEETVGMLLAGLYVTIFLFVALLAFVAISHQVLIVHPMRVHARRIEQDESLATIGSLEVQQMAASYNRMYEENHRKAQALKHAAQTDALTGLLNRGSYDRILEENTEHIALILLDLDNFKNVNDSFGHTIGDKVLKRVAACVGDQFRTTDYACRVGGDEFAVIMTKMHNVDQSIVAHKLTLISDDLNHEMGDVPAITLSIGVAFSDTLDKDGSIYRAADEALYRAKEGGRNRVCFYGE